MIWRRKSWIIQGHSWTSVEPWAQVSQVQYSSPNLQKNIFTTTAPPTASRNETGEGNWNWKDWGPFSIHCISLHHAYTNPVLAQVGCDMAVHQRDHRATWLPKLPLISTWPHSPTCHRAMDPDEVIRSAQPSDCHKASVQMSCSDKLDCNELAQEGVSSPPTFLEAIMPKHCVKAALLTNVSR